MFKVGDKVKDKEYGIIVTIEDREYKNGWYYLCSLPSGAMGYRYEYELEIPINKEMEDNKWNQKELYLMIFWKYIIQYHVTLFIIVVLSVKMKIYVKCYIKYYYQ